MFTEKLLTILLLQATDEVVCGIYHTMMAEEAESERNDGDESCQTFNAREQQFIHREYDRRCEREAVDEDVRIAEMEVPF